MAALDDLTGLSISPLTEEQQAIVDNWQRQINDPIASCFEDSDFLEQFLKYVPKDKQLEFVRNTSMSDIQNANPKFVLVFRRTIPSETPKPEVFWTTEFGVVRNGLRYESPKMSAKRVYSTIFVTTIDNLLQHKASKEDERETEMLYGDGSSDGEIRISSNPFNQKECLFSFKPKHELEDLVEYEVQLKN